MQTDSTYKLRHLVVFTLFCCTYVACNAQDPFFSHFFNNRSQFNPALTGIGGSLSIQAKHKSQWKTGDVPAFDRANMDGFAVQASDLYGAEEHTPIA